MLSIALAFKSSKSGNYFCRVCFLAPKAPEFVKFMEDCRLWLCLETIDFYGVWFKSLLMSAFVMKAPPGKNFVEFTPIKSAFDSWILFLCEIKFTLEVGLTFLFSMGSILSPLNKAKIFSYLPDNERFDVMCVFLSFGSKTASFLLLAEAARESAALSSFSEIPAPLNRASLCCLFSSSVVTNSY